MGWFVSASAQPAPAPPNPANDALEKACDDGNLDQVKALVEQQGASVNAQVGGLGFTPLMAAADGGHLDVLNYLISKHAILDFPDHEGSTALLHACWTDHPDCAVALIDAGENVNFGSNAGRRPLMYAAMHGDDTIVKDLIAHKVKLDANCSEGPAVLWAAANDKLSTVMLLTDAGAKLDLLPDHGDPKKYSVLAMAAANNDVPMIDYLLQHGLDVNFPDADGSTPLMAAMDYNRLPAAQHLLDAGAKTELQDNNGETALMRARDVAAAQVILAKHPDLEIKNKQGQTALLRAASWSLDQVRAFVEAGADVNATDPRGETALTIAGDVGYEPVVAYLREKGARLTEVHIIDKGPATLPLTPAQAWALAVGVIYMQRDGLNPKILGGGRPPDDGEKGALKRDWNITNHDSLLKQLDDLHNHGHHVSYQQDGQRISAMSDIEFNEFVANHPTERTRVMAMKASYLKWKERSGVAWDLCRSAMLVNEGFAVGYLTEQEAWARLAAIAQQTQSSFTSWQEMSDNFLDGREIWANQRDVRFEACAKLLLNAADPNSPWNQNPWRLDITGGQGELNGSVKTN